MKSLAYPAESIPDDAADDRPRARAAQRCLAVPATIAGLCRSNTPTAITAQELAIVAEGADPAEFHRRSLARHSQHAPAGPALTAQPQANARFFAEWAEFVVLDEAGPRRRKEGVDQVRRTR